MTQATAFGPNGFSAGKVYAKGNNTTDAAGVFKLMRSKEFFHGNATSFSRSVHVNNDFGMSVQGGCLMYMYHGWSTDRSYGYVNWQNAGSSAGITHVDIHEAVNSGVTITMTHDSNYTITFNISNSHTNGHAFHFMVWSGE